MSTATYAATTARAAAIRAELESAGDFTRQAVLDEIAMVESGEALYDDVEFELRALRALLVQFNQFTCTTRNGAFLFGYTAPDTALDPDAPGVCCIVRAPTGNKLHRRNPRGRVWCNQRMRFSGCATAASLQHAMLGDFCDKCFGTETPQEILNVVKA